MVPKNLLQPSHLNMDTLNRGRVFATWPGLSANLIIKYLPPSTNTALGYLRQKYQNKWPTKPQTSTEPAPMLNQKTHNVFLCYTPT